MKSLTTCIKTLLVCATFLGSSASTQAAVQYYIGVDGLVGTTSTSGSLSGFDVRVGIFNDAFTPTLANYDSWADNFALLTPVNDLVDDSESFVISEDGDSGPFIMQNNTFSLNSNPSGYTGGERLYVWISNSTTASSSTEAALLLTDWFFVGVTGGPQPTVSFGFSNNTQMLFGTSFDPDYTDLSGEFGNRLVTQAVLVPEPGRWMLLLFGCVAVICRRRR
jgi:hypothetical protein